VNSDVLSEEGKGDETETPMKEELIAAARAGFSVQDLEQAENEIAQMNKVSFNSPSSAKFRCPVSSKIIKAIIREKSLKHYGKPWQGSLPKPRISPPRTLGDAVTKNSFVRLRGGRLQPKSFKMALPSTIEGTNEVFAPAMLSDHSEGWLLLPSLVASQERSKANLAPDPMPNFQIPNLEKKNEHTGSFVIMNGDCKAWFHPSKGLNVLFSRVGPKPADFKVLSREALHPNCKRSSTQPSSQRRRSYADALKMDGGGGKGFRSGHRDEEDRDRQQNYGNMNSGGNSGNNSDRQPFNPRRNAQLRYNPRHDRGRAYGSHARGWQRNHHPGYCFSCSRINMDRARAGQTSAQVIANNNQAVSQRASGDLMNQNSNNTQQSQQEPEVPEVFKDQKSGKAKIEEGSSGEGNKLFCFRCYKLGHGKLECKAKL
jgi:hypothetical protein